MFQCLFGSMCDLGTAGAEDAEVDKGIWTPEQRIHWEELQRQCLRIQSGGPRAQMGARAGGAVQTGHSQWMWALDYR